MPKKIHGFLNVIQIEYMDSKMSKMYQKVTYKLTIKNYYRHSLFLILFLISLQLLFIGISNN